MRDIATALSAIDAANAEDPNVFDGLPLALVQGRLATKWLSRLDPDATPELQVTVRAHHLRRWEVDRSEFETGRAGYLRWRRENKRHQADSLAAILAELDWPESTIQRTRDLLARTALRSDSETQTLEDAACLVFLETQFEELTTRIDHDRLVTIVQKTLAKMSPVAISLAPEVALSDGAGRVLAEAAENVSGGQDGRSAD